MATKKFKSDVQLEGAVSLPNKTAQRALALDSSGNIVESLTTEAELALLSGTTSNVQSQLDDKIPDSEKGAANGVATLDAGSKIPSSQLPAIAITEVFVAADITARDALTVGTGDGEVQEGDVVRVTDASADAAITSGAASYIYDGAAYVLLKAGDEVLSVNGETGIVTLDASDIGYTNTTSGLTATDTQAAIDEVEGRLDTAETGLSDHLADAVDAHDASAISYVNTTSSLAATEVQAAIDEVEGRLDTAETGLSDHLADTVDSHDASSISYDNASSGLTATETQAAIDEVEGRLDTAEADIGDISALGTPTNYSTSSEDEVAARLAGIDNALATAGSSEFQDDEFRVTASGGYTSELSVVETPNFNQPAIGTTYIGQSFTTTSGFDLGRINLELKDGSNSPVSETFFVDIFTAPSNQPTGLTLGTASVTTTLNPASGSFQSISFDFSSPISLDPATKYVFVLSAPSVTNAIVLSATNAGSYSGGIIVKSTDSGSNWSNFNTWDSSFELFSFESGSSKKLAFEVDGISTSTTRTITMPDNDVDLSDIATNAAAIAALGSAGDIPETSASFVDNQTTLASVIGLAFAAGTVRSFDVHVTVERNTLSETFRLQGVQGSSGFVMSYESTGDDSGVLFDVTSAGQVQYTSTSTGDAGTIKFRAETLTV